MGDSFAHLLSGTGTTAAPATANHKLSEAVVRLFNRFRFTSSDIWSSFILDVYWDSLAFDSFYIEPFFKFKRKKYMRLQKFAKQMKPVDSRIRWISPSLGCTYPSVPATMMQQPPVFHSNSQPLHNNWKSHLNFIKRLNINFSKTDTFPNAAAGSKIDAEVGALIESGKGVEQVNDF